MQTTRRGFLRALGVTAAGVAVASNLDGETLRRFWPGWRAPTLAEPNRELAKAVLRAQHESARSWLERLDAGYRTFDSRDGVVVRSLISNMALPIPEGGTERYLTLRDNKFLMPGDLVELGGEDENVVQYWTGRRPILGAVVERRIEYGAGDEGGPGWPVVRVQVGGLAQVSYGDLRSTPGRLYRLGEPLPADPDRRRVRVPRPSRDG